MFRMFITGTLIVTHPVCRDGHFARIHSGGGELAYSGAGRDEITNIVGGATTPVGWLAVKFGEFLAPHLSTRPLK